MLRLKKHYQNQTSIAPSDRSSETSTLRSRLPRPEAFHPDEAERHHDPVGVPRLRRQEGILKGQEGSRRSSGHLQVKLLNFLLGENFLPYVTIPFHKLILFPFTILLA